MTELSRLFPGGFDAAAFTSTDLADPITPFRQQCEENGLIFGRDGVIADGEIHRIPHASSSKGNAKDGWYLLHLDGKIPAGEFGCWKEPSFQVTWRAEIGREMTIAERIEFDSWLKEAKRKREAARIEAQQEAAEKAEQDVGSYSDASEDHPYLRKKQVKPHGIKIDRAGKLVIPIFSASGEVMSYQTIDADGEKRYLKGGKKEGGFFEIRGNRNVVFVCEGFSTGASVFEATGYSVFVAFDAGSLAPVSKVVREMFPAARIVIAADNDQFTDGNPGVTKAHAAAKAVRGEVVYPTFLEAEIIQGKPTDFNDLQVLRGVDAVKEQIERVTKPIADKLAFEFSRVDSLGLTEIQWIIEGYVESDSLAQIFGDPGCGKSFVAIDMACSIATGTDWHGHEVKQGSVFYIAGEGHNGLARRFKAWELGKGVSLKGAPIYKSHRAAQLYDATEAAIVAESIKKLAEEAGCMPSMIIIDTLARNMGGDENSTEDMNAFVQHLDVYLRQPYRCCVLVVHHSGAADKDRSRGSTALRGALDAEYKVHYDGTTNIIAFSGKKMKDAEIPADKSFNLQQVDLPLLDRHGEPVKGAHLTTVDISGLLKNACEGDKVPLGKNQAVALRVLAAMEESGKTWGGTNGFPSNDDWRDACGEEGIDRRRYKEAIEALIGKGRVEAYGDAFRIVRKRPESSETDEFGGAQ